MGDSTAPLYRVTVLPEAYNRDSGVHPVFDALVNMESDEQSRLQHQLYRLLGEDYIGDYTIEPMGDVLRVPFENVLDHVVLDLNLNDKAEAEVRAFIEAGKK